MPAGPAGDDDRRRRSLQPGHESTAAAGSGSKRKTRANLNVGQMRWRQGARHSLRSRAAPKSAVCRGPRRCEKAPRGQRRATVTVPRCHPPAGPSPGHCHGDQWSRSVRPPAASAKPAEIARRRSRIDGKSCRRRAGGIGKGAATVTAGGGAGAGTDSDDKREGPADSPGSPWQ